MAFYKLLVSVALLGLVQSASVDRSRVVGGERAEIADFPHALAVLDMIQGGPSGYMCGATNIHRLWALTAAHCIWYETPASQMMLYGGSSSRISGGHIFFITAYHLHPQFDHDTLDRDVAVIAVDPATPLDGFAHVTSIPLPPICNTACCGVCPEGNAAIVAGWGRIDDGSLPEFLHQVSKDLMTNALCNQYWSIYDIPITSASFCTVIENGRDSCNGDSGSAMVRDGGLIGLVSSGSNVCGDGSVPAVYVRLEEPSVHNFIRQYVPA